MIIEINRNKNDKDYKHKVLLCACKKYIKNQNNGILLVNIKCKDDYNIIISDNFEPTDNFEVYCICPLLNYQKNDIFEDYEILDTDYFLVGGHDLNKRKGVIKLYRVNYGKYFDQTKIEYIQDIIIDDNKFKGFRGAISCITQSSKNGDILISCWDGNVYLFGNLNIKCYLNYDKQVKEDELYKYLTENNICV